MNTPEQPDTPQLTRRQLRELRNTASNPVITPEAAAEAATAVVAPLPRAAEPAPVADEPPAAEDVDLAAPAHTRRAARHQERLRTASVPVVDGEIVDDEHIEPGESGEHGEPDVEQFSAAEVEAEIVEAVPVDEEPADVAIIDAVPVEEIPTDAIAEGTQAGEGDGSLPTGAESAHADAAAEDLADAQEEAPEVELPAESAPEAEVIPLEAVSIEPSDDGVSAPPPSLAEIFAEQDAERAAADPALVDARAVAAPAAEPAPAGDGDRPQVASIFGSALLAGEPASAPLPASFDQLLTRGGTATGSVSAPNALILSQTPEEAGFASPITATVGPVQ